MRVLGIETSCDDTSLCVLENHNILSHTRFSQEVLLKKWGGVVPEIAARNHLEKILPLLEETLIQAQTSLDEIDLIAVTTHPGLLGPLLTGLNAAKTLSLIKKIPIIGVNHLYAHLEAIHLTQKVEYPYLGVLVSGGHSLYFHVKSSSEFILLGTTLDDAIGESLDKGGKLMGLSYPAGREIDQLAEEGNPSAFKFPIALKNDPRPMLSFSGPKNALRLLLDKSPEILSSKQGLKDVCASYRFALIEALTLKCHRAIQKVGQKLPIVVGGGVAASIGLRRRFHEEFENVHFVDRKFCTDNGAMIAFYGLLNAHLKTPFPECLKLDAHGRFLPAKGLKNDRT